MSTKTSIKHEFDEATGTGFYLYEDWLDECVGQDVVYLRLEGVLFEACVEAGKTSLTVSIPREMAGRLGLLPTKEPLDGTQS
jgi:hypothetical protein